jgi:membrane-bound lytic murein transglycosylase B
VAPTEAPSVELARTPRQLARILTTAETAIRDLAVRGTSLEQAAWTQQLAYRRLAQQPGWQERVLAMVPRGLRTAVRRNLAASTSLGALVTPQRKLPDWRILRPAPPVELLAAYRRAGAAFGIDWHYLAAIHLVETRMGRIRGRSTAGAQGPMQFLPATWDAYGTGDINDNGDAIMAAARYLAASGAPGDMRGALWSYNHSDHYVDAVSAYAANMRADERAFRGYYYWQVYYTTPDGPVHLPEGYGG